MQKRVFLTTALLLLAAIYGGYLGCLPAFSQEASPSPQRAGLTRDLRSFGSIGDGKHDDSTAFGAAIESLEAAGGGTLSVPCGTYLVNQPQNHPRGNRSVLYFHDFRDIQIVGQGACSLVLTTLPSVTTIEFEGGENIGISHLHVRAVNEVYKERYGLNGGSAIKLTTVTGGTVMWNEVDGASAGAIYLMGGDKNAVVANNTVHGTSGAGIWEDDCGTTGSANCSPSVPPSGNQIINNTLTDTGTGPGMQAQINLDDGAHASGTLISDNLISYTTKDAHIGRCIVANNAGNVIIRHNTCNNPIREAIGATTGPNASISGISIVDNTVHNCGVVSVGASCIVIYNAPGNGSIRDVQIEGNTITGPVADAIALVSVSRPDGVSGVTIKDNKVEVASDARRDRRVMSISNSQNVQIIGNQIYLPSCDHEHAIVIKGELPNVTSASNVFYGAQSRCVDSGATPTRQ